jgi:hypothetical protein
MLGFGKGVLGLGGDKMLPAVLGNFASSAGGALQAGMNILEASTHLDDMDKGSLIEKNDYWAAMGDAELGLAHAVLPWLGPEGQVADKLLSAGEFVVDTAGAVAGSADPDYKFGAGDVTGAMQRASDVSQISPLLNMMNPANPLAAVTSIHRMLQADDALDIFVGEPLQENAGALYDHFAG